jgi:hypothetical protein
MPIQTTPTSAIEDPMRLSKRVTSLNLPAAAWDFMAMEADVLNRNQSVHISDMIMTILKANGFVDTLSTTKPSRAHTL